jgi:chromatin remodeling complex protein RSC6
LHSNPQQGILDARILECFSAIRAEREDSDDDEPLEARKPPRPSQDLLKSDLVHPSSPISSPKRKPVAPRDSRPAKKAKSEYTSDDDAKFAAELDQALNATPVRKTRGGGGATRAKPKSRVRAGDEDKKEKKKRAANPNNAFNAPQLLSPQLAAVVGVTELPRPVCPSLIYCLTWGCRLL